MLTTGDTSSTEGQGDSAKKRSVSLFHEDSYRAAISITLRSTKRR